MTLEFSRKSSSCRSGTGAADRAGQSCREARITNNSCPPALLRFCSRTWRVLPGCGQQMPKPCRRSLLSARFNSAEVYRSEWWLHVHDRRGPLRCGISTGFGCVAGGPGVSATSRRGLWPGPVLRVRMAVHLGEAEERSGDYFGSVVNLASRVEAAGHGGQVLITEAVRLAASTECGVAADLGVHQLGTSRNQSDSSRSVLAQLSATPSHRSRVVEFARSTNTVGWPSRRDS